MLEAGCFKRFFPKNTMKHVLNEKRCFSCFLKCFFFKCYSLAELKNEASEERKDKV